MQDLQRKMKTCEENKSKYEARIARLTEQGKQLTADMQSFLSRIGL